MWQGSRICSARSRKGADETTWSCDGQRGYVYGFFTDDIALFRFRGTRRKFVAEDVFGPWQSII